MSSKASERGGEKGSSEQTAMGLGGVNIEGFNDPRAKTGISNVGESKESDPEWVQRKNPEDMHRYMHTKVTGSERVAGEGVGYDPGSATVATIEGSTLHKSHELAGKADPAALGSVGAETQYGHKQRDRASAGDDTKINREDFGKSTEAREKAGTEGGGIQGEDVHRGFDVDPPQYSERHLRKYTESDM